MNFASIIILLIIAVLVFLALKQVRKKGTCNCSKGSSACDRNCSRCSGCKK